MARREVSITGARSARGRRSGWSLWWLLVPLALVGVLVSVGALVKSDPAPDVVLVGDSLAQEIAPYLRAQLADTTVIGRYFGGTAPCDWLGADLAAAPRRVVIVTFSGNALTPCMATADGAGFLAGPALVDKYRTDIAELVGEIRVTGASVVLVGQPPRGPDAGGDVDVEALNAIYAGLAADFGDAYVDAGTTVEAPDGGFAARLPCLPLEPECSADGSNDVRHPDGVHFCPVAASASCPVYSSGAYRFAEAIAGAADPL